MSKVLAAMILTRPIAIAAGLILLATYGCYRPSASQTVAPATPSIEETRDRVTRVLDSVLRERELNSEVHAAWQVLHGVLAYGEDFPLRVQGDVQPAVGYLLDGGGLTGWQLLPGDRLENGRTGVRATLQPGSASGQGHADQWLAVLSQLGLPLQQSLRIQGEEYQLQDYLQQVQRDLPNNTDQEFSWTLIALTRYLPTDASWQARDGETWSIERLVDAEHTQSIDGGACGGTHRLIGLAMSLEKRRQENAKMTEVWRQTEQLVGECALLAREYQNPDGSFSTNYFQRPGVSADNAQVLATTGHTLEFLAFALSRGQLQEPWVLRAVERLCEVLEATRDLPLECGSLYHAVHGLVIYRDRALSS
jgi:hypothetical protein